MNEALLDATGITLNRSEATSDQVGAQAARRQGPLALSAKQENHFQIFAENMEMVDAAGIEPATLRV